MSDKEMIVNVSKGNPGCIAFLMELARIPEGKAALRTLQKFGIIGSRAYQLWNDCCDRNTQEAAEILGYIEDGRISDEEMRDHIFQPRGTAFNLAELRERKPAGGFLKQKHGMMLAGRVPEGTCEMCATAHDPSYPHNLQSLAYQYKFYDRNGRWPTWKDAMAHCTPEMKEAWTKALEERGVTVE